MRKRAPDDGSDRPTGSRRSRKIGATLFLVAPVVITALIAGGALWLDSPLEGEAFEGDTDQLSVGEPDATGRVGESGVSGGDGPPPPRPALARPAEGAYSVHVMPRQGAARCLAVSDSTLTGAGCDPTAAPQRLRLDADGPGEYLIKVVTSRDRTRCVATDGDRLPLRSCDDYDTDQLFVLTPAGDATYRLHPTGRLDRCVDLPPGGTDATLANCRSAAVRGYALSPLVAAGGSGAE